MIIRKNFQGERLQVFLTIGFFDGIHLGHQKIIREIVKRARNNSLKSCIVTFDRHPSELFSSRKVKLLTSWEEKREIFLSAGIDVVQVFTFDWQFATLSPPEFLEKLTKLFAVKEILVGEEFTFGFKREGNVALLRRMQSQFGYELKTVPWLKLNEKKISSSLLREWLEKGEIEKVTRGIGRPPTILGRVVPGKGRGRKIGYPTANLEPHPQKLLPCSGVYAGRVELEEKVYKALVNVGSRPTFGDLVPGVEVHIIDFTDELYGKNLRINLIKKIRDVQAFPSPLHLVKRLKKDRERVEKILERTYFQRTS
jgi:riboflavin kinase/FMN adenylyltransferase